MTWLDLRMWQNKRLPSYLWYELIPWIVQLIVRQDFLNAELQFLWLECPHLMLFKRSPSFTPLETVTSIWYLLETAYCALSTYCSNYWALPCDQQWIKYSRQSLQKFIIWLLCKMFFSIWQHLLTFMISIGKKVEHLYQN